MGDVDHFKDTEIVAHSDVPLDPNKNVIWCGTIALAWNETIAYLKQGPLVFIQREPLADLLNRQEFTKSDLDSESYAVMAGRKIDHVDEKFREELRRKFGDSANPPKLDTSDSPATPEDVALYAYLYKSLTFATPFNVNVPLEFSGRKVANFGFGFETFPVYDAPSTLSSQVKLLAYTSADNFTVELKTKSPHDHLILAKITPGKTLKESIDAVLSNIKDGEWGIDSKDKVAIPKIDFDLLTHFKKLENQKLANGGRLNTVAENIIFRLNEKGVELKAFATITETLGIAFPPPKPVNLVFDKPFLVLLKRESSPRPYFAMWVGNPTLLVSP